MRKIEKLPPSTDLTCRETTLADVSCSNNAHYMVDGTPMCGTHAARSGEDEQGREVDVTPPSQREYDPARGFPKETPDHWTTAEDI